MDVGRAFAVRRCSLRVALSAILLLLPGCGDDDPKTQTSPRTMACDEDLAAILDALRSGLPTYDYNPAADLRALINRTHLVVTGTVENIARNYEPDSYGPDSPGDDSWTTVSTPDVRIIAQSSDLTPDEVSEFSMFSKWAVRGEIDPLAGPVRTDDLAFVAFLRRAPDVPGGFGIDVQGLHVSCVGSQDAVIAVVEPLPGDVAGLRLEELVAAVSDTAVG